MISLTFSTPAPGILSLCNLSALLVSVVLKESNHIGAEDAEDSQSH